MPTILGREFSPKSNRTPTGMPALEAALWTRFQLVLPDSALRVWFNVGVGDGRDAGENVTATDLAMWLKITQKRIDILIEFPVEIWIVETRRQAQGNAIGRVMLYRFLYRKDPVIDKDIRLAIVTDLEDPDVRDFMNDIDEFYVVV